MKYSNSQRLSWKLDYLLNGKWWWSSRIENTASLEPETLLNFKQKNIKNVSVFGFISSAFSFLAQERL